MAQGGWCMLASGATYSESFACLDAQCEQVKRALQGELELFILDQLV